MRVTVTVGSAAAGPGWEVVLDAGAGELARHPMAATEGAPGVGPAGANVPADTAPHAALTTDAGAAARAALAGRLSRSQPEADDVELMGRYLFDSLIGPVAWAAVVAEAGRRRDRSIELALDWPRADDRLHSLHWELMHDGTVFLAGHPDLAIAVSRVVRGGRPDEPPKSVAPVRVLFVIGSHLADPAIRAGAEIMGLMRRVERGRGAINPRVSQWTTLSGLETAVLRHRPHVVHFVTHGVVRDGRGRLQLWKEGVPPGGEDPGQLVDADAVLLALRHPDDGLPPLVVLTACQTGTGAADHTAPFAVELVAGGVPAVVGMTGSVTDMACRLFSQRFGEVLTTGGALIEAVSLGRRAALREKGGPGEGMSWALPALFLSPGITHGYAPVDATAVPAVLDRILGYGLDDEPVFCGRREHFEVFEQLLDRDEPANLLVAYTEEPMGGVGKTRLIHEFARRALRDGHVVVLVRDEGDTAANPPSTCGKLGAQLLWAIHETRGRFGLEFLPDSALLETLADRAGEDVASILSAPEALRSGRLARFIKRYEGDLEALELREVLAPDLARLGQDARAARAAGDGSIAEDARVLVLLESVDRWEVAGDLFSTLLGTWGLGTSDERVPVALTCTFGDVEGVDMEEVRGRTVGGSRRFLPLAPFTGDEESLAYQWVLLNPRERWAPDSKLVYATRRSDGRWLDTMRRSVKGLPGRIDGEVFYTVAYVLSTEADPELIAADDEDVLRRWPQP